MSQNIPFLFGAGQAPPVPQAQQPQPAPSMAAPQVNGNAASAVAFLQNSQLPAELANLTPDQLALIGRLLQTGALNLNLPPSAAQAVAPALSLPVAQNGASQAPVQPEQPPQQPDVNMEKEDGELEEGEEPDTVQERGFLHPPPTGPRKRSASPLDRYGRSNGDRRASFQDTRNLPNPAKARKVSEQQPNGHSGRQIDSSTTGLRQPSFNSATNGQHTIDKGSAARAFVLQMHNAGYSYEDLAKELPNHAALRRMYQALGLPLPPPNALAKQAPLAKATSLTQLDGHVASPGGAKAEVRKVSAKLPPAKPAPANRQEYLAKLAALKKSSGPPPAPTKPVDAKAPTAAPSAEHQKSVTRAAMQEKPSSAAEESLPAAVVAPSPPEVKPAVGKSTIQTELVKKKLAELKASMAKKAEASQPSSDQTSPSSPASQAPVVLGMTPTVGSPATTAALNSFPANRGLGVGIANVGAQAAIQSSNVQPTSMLPSSTMPPPLQTSFPPPTPSRPFSGLPGLFVASPPVHASPYAQPTQPSAPVVSANQVPSAASPAAAPAALNVTRKRPVAADFDNDVPTASAAKRPVFGQSRSGSESERIVIEADSDDEEDEEDDDESVEMAAQPIGTKPLRGMAPLSDFPPRPQFGTGTPPMRTPSGAAGYAQVQKNIDDLKRQIAEKEARKMKANGSTIVTASGANTPDGEFKQARTPIQTATADPPALARLEQTMSAAAIARQQEKATLEKRLKELQAETSGTRDSSAAPAAVTADVAKEAHAVPSDAVAQVLPQDQPADVESDEEMDVSSDEEGEVSEDSPVKQSDHGSLEQTAVELDSRLLQMRENDNVDAAMEDSAVLEMPVQAEISLPSRHDDESTEVEEEEEEEEDDSDSDDDEDVKEDDRAAAQAQQDGSDASGDDTSEASSTASEDEAYEPQTFGRAPVAAEQVPADDMPSSISGAKSSTPIIVTSDTAMADDGLAPELQPNTESPATNNDQVSTPKTSYKPYESALTKFKDYRYHPDYVNNVPGGFKSMTYNHNIDPTKPLCPYEAAGGRCNDKTCANQHFGTMTLTDTDLLRILGTHRMPVQSVDDAKRWKEGLSNLVKQLRASNMGKDANAIASKIAEFRREFIGDPTVTLNLG